MTSSNNNSGLLDAIEDTNVLAWIVKHGIKTENGTPLDFHDHRYLIDIYSDESQNIVEMKAAQLGLSTKDIFKASTGQRTRA